MKIRPIFAWFDFWVGLYWDREKRRLFIFPVPCFGVVLEFVTPRLWRRDPEPFLDCDFFTPGPVSRHATCMSDGHYECARCTENVTRREE